MFRPKYPVKMPPRQNFLLKLSTIIIAVVLVSVLTSSFFYISFHKSTSLIELAPTTGKFLHITGQSSIFLFIISSVYLLNLFSIDFHIDTKYKRGSSPKSYCHDDNLLSKGGAGKYGVLGSDCDSPLELVEDTYRFIATKLASQIEFIIDTGDAVRHNRDRTRPKFSDEGLADHTRIVKYYQKYLDLDKIKVIPTIGNNDEFAHDTTSPHSPLLKNLVKIWAPYRLGLENNHDFLKGGYFNVTLQQGKLRILSLNTLAWYDKNPKIEDCHKNGLGKAQMDWLENHLKHARQDQIKVYIIGHIPPNKKSGKKAYSDSCYKDYLNLAGDYNGVILGHFHGHTNADTLSVLIRKKFNKKHKYKLVTLLKDERPDLDFKPKDITAVLTNGPSIIPVNNPSLRVYSFHLQKGTLLGYSQYYADLKQANHDNKLSYQIEYNSQSTYNLPDLSLNSWREFIPRLINHSSHLYATYSRFVTVSGPKT